MNTLIVEDWLSVNKIIGGSLSMENLMLKKLGPVKLWEVQ